MRYLTNNCPTYWLTLPISRNDLVSHSYKNNNLFSISKPLRYFRDTEEEL